ncbi:MAG: efflux RND transporter periplasmic adaptor subunit [Nitrospirae bacterium]|nr:efflux RND transporter periplasmic adaptor subunit [Nitrospirota bacterium]
MKKWTWIISGIIVVSALFYFSRSQNDKDTAVEIKTSVIKRDDLMLTVGATGVVTPYVEVELKSKAGGEIISFPFEEGDSLKKGEVAVRLDPATEKSRLNQAHADLLIAEAGVEKAKITLKDEELKLKRQKSLFEDKVISRQDLDNAVIAADKAGSDVKIADAGLIRAQETLKEANDRLKDTEIKAPLSGTILTKHVEEGQVISSTTSSASEGTPLFTMADLGRIYIKASVDETDIGRVINDQTVTITVDAYSNKVFKGNVVRIAPKGKVDSTITVFEVTIEVKDEEKSMLRPMMTANVEILTDLRKDVLLVPSEAVRAKGEESGIYKVAVGGPLWVPVNPGISNGVLTEIKGDISEGDKVIISSMEDKTKASNSKNRSPFFLGRGRR